jgi:thymidylate synthase (FAD)
MYASVDLRNLLHFLSLRDHAHAQYEIQVYAKAIRQLIAPVVPATMAIVAEGG